MQTAGGLLRSSLWRSTYPFLRQFSHRTHPTNISLSPCLAANRTLRFFASQSHEATPQATAHFDKGHHLQGLRLRLDLHAEHLIDSHREALREVLQVVGDVPEATEQDLKLIKSEIARLGDGFFMLVVAGEYNSGKSSLVNALLGRDVLAEGPTPTTGEVTKLKYAEESAEPTFDENGVLVLGEPVQVLASRLQIVDTPGTNAIDRNHEALTRDFLPLCDLVLLVTSADRPFSESERQFLESIRKWGKKVLLIVNKTDLLESADAKEEVLRFVSQSARPLLGSDSKVFGLSARAAKQAKNSSDGTEGIEWQNSGFAPLEDYINETLDSVERLRLKLRASASIGQNLTDKYVSVLSANLVVVDSDRKMLRDIERRLERYQEYVRKGYPAHFARVDTVLNDAVERSDLFFDNHIRLGNAWRLTNGTALEEAFEEEVVKGTAKAVQRQIHAVAEWLTDSTSKSLADTTAAFSRRVGERARELESLQSEVNLERGSSLEFSGFPSGRDMDVSGTQERLVSRLTETAEELVSGYLSRKEGERIADRMGHSVRMTNLLGLGSVGSMSLFLLNTASIVPEIFLVNPAIPLLAGGLGALAASLIPRQRRYLRAEVRSRIENIRTRLQKEMQAHLEEQVVSHVSSIQQAIQPFSDFSSGHADDLQSKLDNLVRAGKAIQSLDEKLAAIDFPKPAAKD